MAINFVKMTKLKNVSGRIDYITNEKRQEKILLSGKSQDNFDWKKYTEFEKEFGQKNSNQGRELIFALPNEWKDLDQKNLDQRCRKIIESSIKKNTGYEFAVHHNLKNGIHNLHMHVVFCEREKVQNLETQERYKKDVWIKADGTLAKSKAERFQKIHSKGDLKFDKDNKPVFKNSQNLQSQFSNKNPIYTEKKYLLDVKNQYENILKDFGIDAKNRNIIHQLKEFKGMPEGKAQDIKKCNELIKNINSLYFNLGKDSKKYFDSYKSAFKVIRNDQGKLKDMYDTMLTGYITSQTLKNNLPQLDNLRRETKARKEIALSSKKFFTGMDKEKVQDFKESNQKYKDFKETLNDFDGINKGLLSGDSQTLQNALKRFKKNETINNTYNQFKANKDKNKSNETQKKSIHDQIKDFREKEKQNPVKNVFKRQIKNDLER